MPATDGWRLAAAQQLGLDEVPVVRIGHLTSEQKRAYLLADNRLAELSGWDTDILKIELEELSVLNLPFDFEITGFDSVDIDRLHETPRKVSGDADDDLPELAELPVSCLGDLWALGPHRLLCGNACEMDSYQRLLGATAVDMVFTDPPYNVPIQGHVTTQARHREFAMASGQMTPQEFTGFLERSFRLMHEASANGAIHFICMDWRHLSEILAAAAPMYGKPKQLCVWAKDNAGMGSFYRSHHELVFVFKVGDAPHINNFGLWVGRYRTNLWQYPSHIRIPVRFQPRSTAPHGKADRACCGRDQGLFAARRYYTGPVWRKRDYAHCSRTNRPVCASN